MELAARYADVTLQRSRILAPLISLVQVLALVTSADVGIPLTPSIIAINIAVIAVGVALSVLMFTRRVTNRWAGTVATFVFWSPVITSGLSFVETHQQHLFVLLLLEMCAGAVMLSWRWLLGSFVVFDVLFMPIALRLEKNETVFAMLAMLSAQLFAFVFQRLMVHSLEESEQRFGELARSEQARAELADQLVHAQRLEAVGTLAAGLAHDMNNVLAAIMGLADGLAETVEDPLARADASDILREAERGAELTRGLLSFSRRGHYRREVLRIGALVDEVAALLGRTLPPSTTAHEPLPGAVSGSPGEIDWAAEEAALRTEMQRAGTGWPTEVIERLLAVYGTRCRELLALSAGTPDLGRVVGSGRSAVVAAEVVLAVQQEGAVHLTDVLHRRTMVGLEPGFAREIERPVAELAAPLLGWSPDDVEQEVAAHGRYVAERLLGGLKKLVPPVSS